MPQLPVIDGFEFARSGSRLSGDWPAKDLGRLREVLHAPEGNLRFELRGLPDAQGHPGLQVTVAGRLQLTCQRCLGPLPFELQAGSLLLLFADEAELAATPVEAEGPERIAAGGEMPVLDLIEDEVLLALPYAPRHGECSSRHGDAPGAKQRPFAGLSALLDGKH